MSGLKGKFSGVDRLYEIADKRSCTGCSACACVCPAACIQMRRDKEGFFYPVIDKKRCINCGKCRTYCPGEPEDDGKVRAVLAGYSHSPRIQRESSSGGVFTHLAEEVLKRDGLVFGVEMQGSRASMCSVEKPEELCRLRGSKYVQSWTGNAYSLAKEYLDKGRWVLFSGTPCQIAGLLATLKKKYSRLITVDFVCHGICSPSVLEKYLMECGNGKNARKISFRDKTEGWKNFSMKIEWEDHTISRTSSQNDPYLQSFLKNLNLRSSCFSCKFRKIHRESDITLGDLWGAEKFVEEWTEDQGYSLILLQSQAGEALWKKIEDQVVSVSVELSQVLLHNASLKASPWDEYSRNLFFKGINKYDLEQCMMRAEKNGFKKKAGRKLWKIKDFIPSIF